LVGAATHYVSTSGNDVTGNGSLGNPWATIDQADAAGRLDPDDVVIVQAGTYPQANRNGVHLSSAAAIYVAEGNVLIDQSSNIGKLLDQNFVHHSCFFRQLRLNSRPVVINSS